MQCSVYKNGKTITQSSRIQNTKNLRGIDINPHNILVEINYTWTSPRLLDYVKDIIYTNGSQSHFCMIK